MVLWCCGAVVQLIRISRELSPSSLTCLSTWRWYHRYRGVFGSHVAAIFRRLQRLCAHYGSRPQYIGCSATIANGEEHFSQLVPSSGACKDPVSDKEVPSGGVIVRSAAAALEGAARERQPGESVSSWGHRTQRPLVLSADGSPSVGRYQTPAL